MGLIHRSRVEELSKETKNILQIEHSLREEGTRKVDLDLIKEIQSQKKKRNDQ